MKMMLQKYPQKSSLGMMGILKGAIIAETTIFCGVAVTWYALCNYPGMVFYILCVCLFKDLSQEYYSLLCVILHP